MSFLSRDAILAAKQRGMPTREVAVPYFAPDAKIKVRGLSTEERSLFEESLREGKGKHERVNTREYRARLLIASAVDPTFTEADIPLLNGLPAMALEPAINACMELSGISDADVEQTVGNSVPTGRDASATASPKS